MVLFGAVPEVDFEALDFGSAVADSIVDRFETPRLVLLLAGGAEELTCRVAAEIAEVDMGIAWVSNH